MVDNLCELSVENSHLAISNQKLESGDDADPFHLYSRSTEIVHALKFVLRQAMKSSPPGSMVTFRSWRKSNGSSSSPTSSHVTTNNANGHSMRNHYQINTSHCVQTRRNDGVHDEPRNHGTHSVTVSVSCSDSGNCPEDQDLMISSPPPTERAFHTSGSRQRYPGAPSSPKSRSSFSSFLRSSIDSSSSTAHTLSTTWRGQHKSHAIRVRDPERGDVWIREVDRLIVSVTDRGMGLSQVSAWVVVYSIDEVRLLYVQFWPVYVCADMHVSDLRRLRGEGLGYNRMLALKWQLCCCRRRIKTH